MTPLSAAPYALSPHRFPFPALAARAGSAALGGEREVALACLMAARLVAGATEPAPLPTALRTTRAVAARAWFAALALPAALRAPLARLADASARDVPADLASALGAVATGAKRYLDARSHAELLQLAGGIAG